MAAGLLSNLATEATMRRRRRAGRFEIVFALLIAAGLIGASVWLDRGGTQALVPVLSKSERVTPRHDPQGTWYRWYEVGVGTGSGGGAPWGATVEVSEQRFDAIAPGDSVEVRYIPQLPVYARASDRTTGTVVREAVGRVGLAPLVLWLVLGAAGLWIAARLGTLAVIAGGIAWMATGVPVLLRAPAPDIPVGVEGVARVSHVRAVAKSPERSRPRRRMRARSSASIRRLAVPYEVVQLRLAIPGRDDSVLVVDAVDSGSVPGLAMGAVLPVRYEADAPREARLAQGTRRFIQRNRYHFLPAVIGLPAIGMLAASGFRWRRRRSEERAAAKATTGPVNARA